MHLVVVNLVVVHLVVVHLPRRALSACWRCRHASPDPTPPGMHKVRPRANDRAAYAVCAGERNLGNADSQRKGPAGQRGGSMRSRARFGSSVYTTGNDVLIAAGTRAEYLLAAPLPRPRAGRWRCEPGPAGPRRRRYPSPLPPGGVSTPRHRGGGWAGGTAASPLSRRSEWRSSRPHASLLSRFRQNMDNKCFDMVAGGFE